MLASHKKFFGEIFILWHLGKGVSVRDGLGEFADHDKRLPAAVNGSGYTVAG